MLSIRDNLVAFVWYLASKTRNSKNRWINNILIVTIVVFIHNFICILTSNDLSTRVVFKGKPKIYHAIGIIVGSKVQFGSGVILRAHVCLGEKKLGTGSAPVIGNNVEFGIGAKVFGNISIPDDSFVKSNSTIV